VDQGWRGAENRASTGIGFSGLSGRNESLYRKICRRSSCFINPLALEMDI